jgi:hypothetical protein
MSVLSKMRMDLLEWGDELQKIKSDIIFGRLMRAAAKAGYNSSEPRDAYGRWTDGSNGAAGDTDFSAARRQSAVAIDYSGAMTGISTIDDVTKTLSETLGTAMSTMDFIPEWTPQVYGTAVHVAFGTAVRFEGIRGIGFTDVEHSFKDGVDAEHGELGSIRTDVLLRNEIGDIIAIYDVKTGQAGLSPGRVQQIRDHTGVQSNIPIIELSVVRGVRIKSSSVRGKWIGAVIARLWRAPDAQGNPGLVSVR